MTSKTPTQTSLRPTHLLPWFLLAAGFLVYLNSITASFAFDDDHHIIQSTRIRQLWPITPLLSVPRPLVEITLAINYALDGHYVEGYHLFNITIHTLAGLALFGLVHRTLLLPNMPQRTRAPAPYIAAACALLFIIHPLQTQAVTYIIQRAESMMGLFYFLTLYAAARALSSRRPNAWHAAAILACALGMASKQVIVTAPVIVILYDHVFASRDPNFRFRKRAPLYLGLAATWSLLWLSGILNVLTHKGASTGFNTGIIAWWQYAISQPGIILHYLRLSVWPDPLCLDYGWPIAKTPWQIYAPAIPLALIFIATLYTLYKRSWLGFMSAWFFGILTPTSSVVPVIDLAVEHRVYTSLAAVVVTAVILAHAAIHRLVKCNTRRAVYAATLLTLVAAPLATATVLRNLDYQNGITLWQSVLRVSPNNPRAHHNLGSALHDQGFTDQAMAAYETAISLVPNYADAYNNLGKIWLDQGNPTRALDLFKTALSIKPKLPEFHYNVGRAHMDQTDTARAEQYFHDALAIDPEFAKAHVNLGLIRLKQNNPAAAHKRFAHAATLDTESFEAHYNLGKLLLDNRQPNLAIQPLRRAVELNPHDAPAHTNLGVAFATLNKPNLAIQSFQNAINTDPNYLAPYLNLATAHRAQGNHQQAKALYQQALKIAQQTNQTQWTQAITGYLSNNTPTPSPTTTSP